MKIEELIHGYVTPICRFESILPANYQAEDIYNHYRKQVNNVLIYLFKATFNEIESFTRVRFNRKFKEINETQDQQDWLNNKAKEISALAQ